MNALVKSNSTLQLGQSKLSLSATSTTSSKTSANAQQTSSGATGIGASFALRITDHETLASIENDATVVDAASLSVIATASHANETNAVGGASGGKGDHACGCDCDGVQ